MSASLPLIPFALVAVAIIGGALMMVLSRNVVHATLWMLETMLATAALYLMLSAEFLALVQIMVYAGAVSVLVLFVVMLTLRRRQDSVRPLDLSPVAAVLAVVVVAVVSMGITRFTPKVAAAGAKSPDIARFGELLFDPSGPIMLPFEVASLVLLVALVGAVWWAGGERQ